MCAHPDALRLRFAILAMVVEAVENGQVIRTHSTGGRLLASHPRCGMTAREIEDEIILQIGMAKGTAEIGATVTPRRRFAQGRGPASVAA